MQDLTDGRALNCRPLEPELTTLPTVQKVLPPNYLPVSLSVRLLVSSIISLLFEFLCFLLVLWSLYMFICLFHCLSSLCFFHFYLWFCMFLTRIVISLHVYLSFPLSFVSLFLPFRSMNLYVSYPHRDLFICFPSLFLFYLSFFHSLPYLFTFSVFFVPHSPHFEGGSIIIIILGLFARHLCQCGFKAKNVLTLLHIISSLRTHLLLLLVVVWSIPHKGPSSLPTIVSFNKKKREILY